MARIIEANTKVSTINTTERYNKSVPAKHGKQDSTMMSVVVPVPVYPSPSMNTQPHHDPSSGKLIPSQRKHPSSNTSTFLDRQNAQRKRQRRQTAGALVTGLFGNNDAEQKDAAGKKTTKKKSTAQPRPQIQVPPRGIGPIYDPNVNDVLCGRGGRINAHEGNVRFRQVVVDRKKDYLAPTTKKLEKAHIAANIVQDIRQKDPPGRFLKEDPDGSWYDIGDAKAIKKVGQALREDAPDIRHEIGSDEEEEGHKGASPSPVKGKTQDKAATPNITLATVPIATATAVSGRGAKVITSSQRSVSSQQKEPYTPLAYQAITAPPASYQPIIPPSQDQHQGKTIFPGMRGGRNTGGVSGAAAAAMSSESDPNFPTQDVAFGRQFHVPENGGDSMISGMSGGTGGAGGTQLSGMSGISALTDPMSSLSGADPGATRPGPFQQPAVRPQNSQQFQAMRMNQLQQLRQNWQQPTSQRTMNTLTSSDLRSIGGMSLQRSLSWQSGHPEHPHMDTMSWAEHSLMGGGVNDVNSVVSGQQSFHSYYLRDAAMGGQSVQGGAGPMASGTSYGGSSLGLNFSAQPSQQQQQPPMPSPAQFYHGGSSGSHGENSDRTERITGSGNAGPSGNASVASMSIASGSISGSIMSDLSENLIALDLAEPRLLDQFDSQGQH